MANYVTQTSDKDKKTAAILCACGFLGIGGLHYFYVGRIGKGVLYLCTFGFFLIGTIFDLVSISTGGFRDNVGAPLRTSNARPSSAPAPKPISAPVPSPVPTPTPIAEPQTDFEFYPVKVAGVTFKNGRKSRQTILRKIKFYDPPFEDGIELGLSKYEFEGNPAISITANGEQIGNVPAAQVPYIMENWCRIESISAINVYGGGKSEDGEEKNFGAEITIRLNPR